MLSLSRAPDSRFAPGEDDRNYGCCAVPHLGIRREGGPGFLYLPTGFFTRKALVNPASLAGFPSLLPLFLGHTNKFDSGVAQVFRGVTIPSILMAILQT